MHSTLKRCISRVRWKSRLHVRHISVRPNQNISQSASVRPQLSQRVSTRTGLMTSESTIRRIIISNREEESDSYEVNLVAYFHSMFLLSISLNSPSSRPISNKRLRIKKIAFAMLSFISVAYTIARIKTLAIFLESNLQDCIRMGKRLSRCFLIITFVGVSAFRRKPIQTMLRVFTKERGLLSGGSIRVGQMVGESTNLAIFRILFEFLFYHKAYWTSWAAVVYAFIRSFITTIQSNFPWNEWNIEEVLGQRAFEFGHILVAWDKNTLNQTHYNLGHTFSGINFQTIATAGVAFVFEFVTEFYEHVLKGFLLSMAITLYIANQNFCKELSEDTSLFKLGIPTKIWRYYKLLQTASEQLNSIYGVVFHFFHADSFLCGAYFLSEVITFDILQGTVVYLFFDIVTIGSIYSLLALSTSANDLFQKWIIERYADTERIPIIGMTTVEDQYSHITMLVLLHELDSSPIGIKTSNILINSAFIVQFVGVVVYYFLLLVDASDS